MRSEFVFAMFTQNLNTERNFPVFIARNRSLVQGKVFTRVCQSFCSQLVAVLSRRVPWRGWFRERGCAMKGLECHERTGVPWRGFHEGSPIGQQAVGMSPTGMHSCHASFQHWQRLIPHTANSVNTNIGLQQSNCFLREETSNWHQCWKCSVTSGTA